MHRHVDLDAVEGIAGGAPLNLGHASGSASAHDGLVEASIERNVVVNHSQLCRDSRVEVNLESLSLQMRMEAPSGARVKGR